MGPPQVLNALVSMLPPSMAILEFFTSISGWVRKSSGFAASFIRPLGRMNVIAAKTYHHGAYQRACECHVTVHATQGFWSSGRWRTWAMKILTHSSGDAQALALWSAPAGVSAFVLSAGSASTLLSGVLVSDGPDIITRFVKRAGNLSEIVEAESSCSISGYWGSGRTRSSTARF